MAIPLKEAKRLQPIQIQRRQIPTEQIINAMGQSPSAVGMQVTGQTVGNALKTIGEVIARKAELRRQGETIAGLEKASGQAPGSYSGLTPEIAQMMASAKIKHTQERLDSDIRKQESLPKIRLLEKNAGLPEGSLGDDYESAKTVFQQLSITKRQQENPNVDLAERRLKDLEDRQFKVRLNNQKNRLVNDPRIKPLYTQDIGLRQIGDIKKIASDGNTVAAAALGVKMARGMGEVGVLTESDVTRYITSGRLDRKAADTLSRWMLGKPTNATMNEIQQISDVLRETFSDKIQPVYNEYIDSFSEVEGLTPDDVSKKMAIPYNPLKMLPNAGNQGLQPFPVPGSGLSPEKKARLEYLRNKKRGGL